MDPETAAGRAGDVIDELSAAVVTDRAFLETVMTGVLAGGHVLLEDVPGTGKTLAARSLAGALNLSFTRICSVEFDDRTGITIPEGAVISLFVVDELDRSTQ